MNTLITIAAVLNLSVCGGVKTGRLLGIDNGIFDALFEIDIDTGEAMYLHYLGVDAGSLAVGPDGTVYSAVHPDDELMIIDPETGEVTFVGPFGFDIVGGLAFGPAGTLYGIDILTDQLITIDPRTGEGTAVGSLPDGGVGLAFALDGTLYLTGNPVGGPRLYTVDPDTAEATEVGLFGSAFFDSTVGLTLIGDVLYASAYANSGPPYFMLVTVDRETGEATLVGGYCPGKDCLFAAGLAFLPGPGDADRDGDVDLDDFAIFQFCFTGPLETEDPLPVECRFLDTDKDNDLDLQDFADFQGAFTGPNDDGE